MESRSAIVLSSGTMARTNTVMLWRPTRIARDWNVKASGMGNVTRSDVEKTILDRTRCTGTDGPDEAPVTGKGSC